MVAVWHIGVSVVILLCRSRASLPPPRDDGNGKDMLVGWLCFTSHRQRCHLETHLLSLAKDVKLGIPNGNRTQGRRVAVHYTAAASHQLHLCTYLVKTIGGIQQRRIGPMCLPLYTLRSIITDNFVAA